MDNNAPDNESIILNKVAQGDREAFRVLYDAYQLTIYSFAYSITHSQAQAQEITQEVFIKVWENREQLLNMQFFAAWIKTIARNTAYVFFRRNAIELKVLTNLSSGALVSHDPQIALEQKELYARLRDALSSLSAQQLQIYQLSREEGKTYAEIAIQLGLSAHTIKYHLSSIYARLREKLGPMILIWVLSENI